MAPVVSASGGQAGAAASPPTEPVRGETSPQPPRQLGSHGLARLPAGHTVIPRPGEGPGRAGSASSAPSLRERRTCQDGGCFGRASGLPLSARAPSVPGELWRGSAWTMLRQTLSSSSLPRAHGWCGEALRVSSWSCNRQTCPRRPARPRGRVAKGHRKASCRRQAPVWLGVATWCRPSVPPPA